MNSSRRILIADSDKDSLLNMADLLQREGYQCTAALDGFEAFRAMEALEYDLLITEIKLPGNEELELVWSAYIQRMPVIIYTGYPSLHSAIASIQLSVMAYLIKPTSFDVLLRHVKTNLASDYEFKSFISSRQGLHSRRYELAQIDQLSSAIIETIDVLQSTRSAFRSKKLAALRRKLERLIAGEQPYAGKDSA